MPRSGCRATRRSWTTAPCTRRWRGRRRWCWAAALLHQLARVPALENANRLFAAATAVAYLAACGLPVVPDVREAARLAGDAAEGTLDVGAVSWVLRNWCKE